MTRLLRPLQRAFLYLNRGFMAPAIKAGLGAFIGNPLTSYIMVLRTRGRRTGLVREAPLGYVLRDGAVYCVAGYGEAAPWYRNLVEDPQVTVVLPGRSLIGRRVIRCRAEPVADDAEWATMYRALIGSFGLVGRLVVADPSTTDDATLIATSRGLPVIRITPLDPADALVPGPYDPGGSGWIATVLLPAVVGTWLCLRRGRRSA